MVEGSGVMRVVASIADCSNQPRMVTFWLASTDRAETVPLVRLQKVLRCEALCDMLFLFLVVLYFWCLFQAFFLAKPGSNQFDKALLEFRTIVQKLHVTYVEHYVVVQA